MAQKSLRTPAIVGKKC